MRDSGGWRLVVTDWTWQLTCTAHCANQTATITCTQTSAVCSTKSEKWNFTESLFVLLNGDDELYKVGNRIGIVLPLVFCTSFSFCSKVNNWSVHTMSFGNKFEIYWKVRLWTAVYGRSGIDVQLQSFETIAQQLWWSNQCTI